MKVITISAKCSDLFWSRLTVDGTIKGEYEGYVPDFFPDEHYGDYVILDIDADTGQILNWKKPTAKDLEIFKNNS
jgi:hypothetical protein